MRPILALLLSVPLPAQCPGIGTFASTGSVPTNLLPAGTAAEISGMAASRHNPGVLWVHDDSAGAPQVLALRSNGALAQQYSLTSTTNRDWEDVALGPGPVPGRDYLYLAEIGNNALGYTSFSLLRLPEPDVPANPAATIALPPPEAFRFRYPTGTWNAETLWIDPVDGTPWLLTKVSSSTCSLFRYPMPLDPMVEKVLVLAATLTGMPTQFTGGAITADGRVIFARTVTTICAWRRPAGTAFASAFATAPCSYANAQGQGEAISVSADGLSLWAISEGSGALVRRAPLTLPFAVTVSFAFGSGLTGGPGVPGLAATAVPRLGGPPFDLAAWQVAPNAAALLAISLTGLPDGIRPFAGGWLHAVPDSVLPLAINASGMGAFAVPLLPDSPVLYGLAVYAQVATGDAQAVQGIALSRGLQLVLDR